jgi:hypothetical protein
MVDNAMRDRKKITDNGIVDILHIIILQQAGLLVQSSTMK